MFHHHARLLCQVCQFPRQNQAEGGTSQIKVYPTKVRQHYPNTLLLFIPFKSMLDLTGQDEEDEEEDGFVKVREDSVSSCGSLELMLASKLGRQPGSEDDVIRESHDHDGVIE